MRKTLMAVGACLLFVLTACTKDELNVSTDNLSPVAIENPQQTFAEILSKAVYENEDMRRFLQEEAVAEFDNDYDVFYPFVKDKEVSSGKTFRDCLVDYSDEATIARIEYDAPLLNILVPDLSWYCDFNAETWDVSDNTVGVTYLDGNDDNAVYGDGKVVGCLADNELPGFPILVVKYNERMKVSGGLTKGAGLSYEFISDAYDNMSPATKGRTVLEWDIDLPIDGSTELVPESAVEPLVIEAWEEFKGNDYAAQRDYVYYGMTNEIKEGTLNRYIREKIFRFKLSPGSYGRMADQRNDYENDPQLSDLIEVKKDQLSTTDLINRIWKDGQFEMDFNLYYGTKDNHVRQKNLQESVNPRDVFDLSKVHVASKHGTWFAKAVYDYTFDASNLVSKWYYPKSNLELDPWDISRDGANIYVEISERDSDQKITQTESFTYTFSNAFTYGTSSSVSVGTDVVKIGYGTTTSSTISASDTETTTTTIETTLNSDDLGSANLWYDDPIILSSGTENGIKGYKLYSVTTGSVEIEFMPVHL